MKDTTILELFGFPSGNPISEIEKICVTKAVKQWRVPAVSHFLRLYILSLENMVDNTLILAGHVSRETSPRRSTTKSQPCGQSEPEREWGPSSRTGHCPVSISSAPFSSRFRLENHKTAPSIATSAKRQRLRSLLSSRPRTVTPIVPCPQDPRI